ncbi:uncharacterized protein [Clytia hemisphaerica]|uniref:uncharacterized protein n=1 Tax=Clytia hemisphaerica TaxID=252671 RepID=UPI0034D4A1AB
MDSAHGDERNLAHSATGRNVTRNTDSIEIAKLKEEHEKQIQKLTFENRIKTLELEKEMSKQDNEQKMKILQLEKDNQSLSHELELVKLKTAHKTEANKGVVDQEMEKEMLKQENEFQKKLADKDKEIVAKENDCKTKINEMEKITLAKEHEYQTKLAAKENEFKLKVKALENTNKIKLEQMEREKELAIQALRNEIEILKSNNAKQSQNDFKPENTTGAMKKAEKSFVATKEDKLIWGVNEFFLAKKSVSNLYASYQKWYEAISGLLENKVQVNVNSEGKKMVFIRKEMPTTDQATLYLVTKRRNVYHGDGPNALIVNHDNKEELKKAKSFLLHPKQKEMCIENNGYYSEHEGFEEWRHPGVTNDHYFGEKKSIIMFLIFKNE